MTAVYELSASPGWNLSGGDRTQAPTPRRRQRAREEGKSWKSHDFQAAAALIVAFLMLKWYMPWLGAHLATLEISVFQNMRTLGFTQGLGAVMALVLPSLAEMLAPIVLALAMVGLLIGIVQGGLNFRLQGLVPDFNRLNPITAVTQMFSMNGLFNLLKGFLKIAVVGVSAGLLIRQQVAEYPGLMSTSLGASLQFAKTALTGVLLRAGLAYLFVGIIDLIWQMRSFQQSLRMSHREVKDEHKDVEGDPRLKGRRRELQRRYARVGLKAVRSSTVVVTNPTHFAVALRWDDTMAAPELVAKGEDEFALRIRAIAYQYGVPVVENPPVARALYVLPVGRAILPEHYQVVAEIIAFILRRRQGRGG